MNNKPQQALIHAILIFLAILTLVPFWFALNNSMRTNNQIMESQFRPPESITNSVGFTIAKLKGDDEAIQIRRIDPGASASIDLRDIEPEVVPYSEAMAAMWRDLSSGYRMAWGEVLNTSTWNSLFVTILSVLGVLLLGSTSAYIFSRYKFPGAKVLFMLVLSVMMIPGILTLVPSYLIVKDLGLLDTYWVMILPYVSGGQIMAIFLFKGFFDGLPEDLFESARLDGAGHAAIYLNIVLPLSKPIMSVVAILTAMAAWNNFLWPFITVADGKFLPITAGLYTMSQSAIAANMSTMLAGYVVASVPLLLLFIFATKPFVEGVTSGAFKA